VITLATTTGASVAVIALGAVLLWLIAAAMVATYGSGKGFPFWPLFLCGAFLGWPLVLLAIVIGAGPRPGSSR
jgi:hypothetical protein